jgi:chorismate synthase
MSGNTFGTLFCVTNFGESHGPAIGCVIDGCPPGMALTEADIQHDLDRRRPGTSKFVTQRNEPDAVEILSGVYEGKTTGTPIALLIRNTDQRSKDYGNILQTFRPGHADYTYWQKFGIRDPRGGGRSSARLTAPTVAAGAVAKKWLKEKFGTTFHACMTQIGDVSIPFESWDHVPTNPFFAPVADVSALEDFMNALRKSGDSCGARLRVVAQNMPVGLGQPLYDKLDADIAYAMMGLNAVKGVEIGAGFRQRERSWQHARRLAHARRLRRQQGRRCARRHQHRAGPGRVHRHQAHQLDPGPPRLHRRRRRPHRSHHQRPPRPLRRHPRRAHHGGAARAGGDGPRAAAPCAVR